MAYVQTAATNGPAEMMRQMMCRSAGILYGLITTLLLIGCGDDVDKTVVDTSILEGCLDQDLHEVPPERLELLSEALRNSEAGTNQWLRPWYVFKTSLTDQPHYIVLERERIVIVPSSSRVRITLFDATGALVRAWGVSAGWRHQVTSAGVIESEDLGTHLIVIQTTRPFPIRVGAPPGSKQYYAISKRRLRLVRLEDLDGRLVRNTYAYPNQQVGVASDLVSRREWLGRLESGDPVDILSALVFLGGEHLNPKLRREDVLEEDRQQCAVFERLLHSADVRQMVEEYAHSPNPWIREAARSVVLHSEQSFSGTSSRSISDLR